MAGKMTILDRLMKEGRIVSPSPARDLREMGRVRDPLVGPEGRPDFRKIYRDSGLGKYVNMTPERLKYQRGIEARLEPKKIAAEDLVDETFSNREDIENEWQDAVSDAKESMRDDWESGLDYQSFEDVDPNYLEVDAPSTDLRDYWPSSARSPEEIGESFESAQDAYWDAIDARKRIYGTQGIMDEQVMTPRYHNYQRAMQQRAANKRMGHQLSRMWGDAYQRLRARGLSDAEARMFIRERFGGR